MLKQLRIIAAISSVLLLTAAAFGQSDTAKKTAKPAHPAGRTGHSGELYPDYLSASVHASGRRLGRA